MILQDLYGVYDVKALKFVSYFASDNEETAKRSYLNSLQQVPPLTARDLRLYHIDAQVNDMDCFILPDKSEIFTDKELDR